MLQPFFMSVDFKQKKQIREPIVTQNDDLIFVVTVFDNGETALLDNLSYKFVSRRPDNKSYYVDGVQTGGNEITFDLGKSEVSLIGKVNAAVQLFDSNNQRLSSFTFNYTVTEDISLSEELSSQDRTLLEIVVQDGPGLVDYFTQAKPLIEEFTDYVDVVQRKADVSYVDVRLAGAVNGSPIPVSLAASMTDRTRNYVYTGSEAGYTAGHWYGWNGATWVDGGVYQSTGITDKSIEPTKMMYTGQQRFKGIQYPLSAIDMTVVTDATMKNIVLNGVLDLKIFNAVSGYQYRLRYIAKDQSIYGNLILIDVIDGSGTIVRNLFKSEKKNYTIDPLGVTTHYLKADNGNEIVILTFDYSTMVENTFANFDDTYLKCDKNRISSDCLVIDLVSSGTVDGVKLKDGSVTLSKVGSDLIDGVKKITFINVLANSDLVDLTNWNNLLATNVSAANGEISFTPTAQFGQVKQILSLSAIVNNVYYVGAYVKSDHTSTLLNMCKNTNGAIWGSKSHTGSGNYELLSFTVKPTDVDIINFRVHDTATANFTPISFKQPMLINLTEIFGAGNEPTASEFEAMLRVRLNATYFSGKTYISMVLNDTYRYKYNLTNKVYNSDFTTSDYWKYLLASGSITANELAFTASQQYGQVYEQIDPSLLNNVYYVFGQVKSTSKNTKLHLYRSDTGAPFGEALHSGSGAYENLSFICTASAAVATRIRVIDYRTSGFDEIRAKNLMVINLTEIFGAGNEPTISDFEKMIKKYNNGNIFFKGSILTNLSRIDPYIPPSSIDKSMLPIYVNKTGNVVKVNFKYNDVSDMRVTMQPRGGNSIFDFYQFDLVPNLLQKVSQDMSTGTLFLSNGTDFLGPHIVKAVNNINGDLPTSSDFTGGNHGYTGGADGTPTGRTSGVTMFVDGKKVTDFTGYCNFIDLYWTNYVQATNTKKADGTGREVLVENYHMHFDGYKWEVNNRIDFLEDITWVKYYGIQANNYPWGSVGGSIFYHSSSNRKWNTMTAATDSGSKGCNKMSLKKNNDCLEIGLNGLEGIGNKEFLTSALYGAFSTTSNKSYFFLIDSNVLFHAGDSVTFEGHYRFYSK